MILREGRLVIVIKVPRQLMLSWEEGGLAQSQMLLFVQQQLGQSGSLDASVRMDLRTLKFPWLRCRGRGQDLRASIRRTE